MARIELNPAETFRNDYGQRTGKRQRYLKKKKNYINVSMNEQFVGGRASWHPSAIFRGAPKTRRATCTRTTNAPTDSDCGAWGARRSSNPSRPRSVVGASTGSPHAHADAIIIIKIIFLFFPVCRTDNVTYTLRPVEMPEAERGEKCLWSVRAEKIRYFRRFLSEQLSCPYTVDTNGLDIRKKKKNCSKFTPEKKKKKRFQFFFYFLSV